MASVNSATFMRVLFIGAWALAAGCQAGRGSKVHEVLEVPPGIAFEGLRFRAYRGAALAASGEADRASFRRDNGDFAAEAIRVRLPARPGEPDHRVEAPRGTGNLRAGEAHLTGGVVVTLRAGKGD
jgi:hypothetical protein